MKNLALAFWLEHCADFVAELNDPLAPAVFEGVLQTVATGDPALLRSVMADVREQSPPPVGVALNSLYFIKMILWHRLDAELEPDKTWDFILTLEMVFQDGLQALLAGDAVAPVAPPDAEAGQVMAYASELARANRELARLEKARTDFISIAAHELKTPLTVLQGYVDMLRENDPTVLAQAGAGIVRGLDKGTQRMATIVNDLLDVSALETDTLTLNFETVSLESLVRMAARQVQDIAKTRQHRYTITIAPELPPLFTDPARLHQILHHLLTNAVKFTPDGGAISVTVARHEQSVRITVADTGIGISPEDREHIFDKFYRAGVADLHSTGAVKFKGGGIGLGLAIARGVARALGGDLWAQSPGYDEVNCPGSTFTVQLPLEVRE